MPYLFTGSLHYLLHGERRHWTRFAMPHDVFLIVSNIQLSRVPDSGAMITDGFLAGPRGHNTPVVLASELLPR